MSEQQSTVAAEVQAARDAVGDIVAAAEFCVSPIGLLRREDLEIALASEVLRLRAALVEADTLLRFAVGKARTHNQASLIDQGRRQMMARAGFGKPAAPPRVSVRPEGGVVRPAR